jgi:RNA polymerase sigma-70 factor (ECF subfamily)
MNVAATPEFGSSDEALLEAMGQGDEVAAASFVRRYQRRVYGLAYGMLGDTSLAEEVAQEALLRVWRHAQVFDARRASVSTWVLTITRNLAVDSLRIHRAHPTDPDELIGLGLVSRERQPDDVAINADMAPKVRAALLGLPPEQRRALVLAVVYGKSASEIGQQDNIPLGTAKTRIRSGLAKLRLAMIEQESHHDR